MFVHCFPHILMHKMPKSRVARDCHHNQCGGGAVLLLVTVGWESDYHSDKVSQYTFYAATVLSQQKLLLIDNNELLVAKKCSTHLESGNVDVPRPREA